jgi:hypothetical protein
MTQLLTDWVTRWTLPRLPTIVDLETGKGWLERRGVWVCGDLVTSPQFSSQNAALWQRLWRRVVGGGAAPVILSLPCTDVVNLDIELPRWLGVDDCWAELQTQAVARLPLAPDGGGWAIDAVLKGSSDDTNTWSIAATPEVTIGAHLQALHERVCVLDPVDGGGAETLGAYGWAVACISPFAPAYVATPPAMNLLPHRAMSRRMYGARSLYGLLVLCVGHLSLAGLLAWGVQGESQKYQAFVNAKAARVSAEAALAASQQVALNAEQGSTAIDAERQAEQRLAFWRVMQLHDIDFAGASGVHLAQVTANSHVFTVKGSAKTLDAVVNWSSQLTVDAPTNRSVTLHRVARTGGPKGGVTFEALLTHQDDHRDVQN